MEEIPNSEKVFPADKVIIAAGFLGPEKTLAEQFGIKKVSLKCFYKFDCLICFFLRQLFSVFLSAGSQKQFCHRKEQVSDQCSQSLCCRR